MSGQVAEVKEYLQWMIDQFGHKGSIVFQTEEVDRMIRLLEQGRIE